MITNTNHSVTIDDLWELWPSLSEDERLEWFDQLSHDDAEDFFSSITCEDQSALIAAMTPHQQRQWMRILAPDDAADVLQLIDDEEMQRRLKTYLQDRVRNEVDALMAYKEDEAGGLMSPRFARIRPDMSIDEAILYIRRQIRDELETIYYIYVLDHQQHLLGVVSFEDLIKASGDKKVSDVMETDPTKVTDDMDQESVALIFAREDHFALPVVDADNVMKGIITIDDIVDVVNDEATEDFQKMGGMAALDNDYLQSSYGEMYKKRIVWLIALFCCTIFTTRVMDYYSNAIESAVILSVFVPLIMASGGNTGSQAATLITRAMALGEIRQRDVLRVFKREFIVSGCLGLTLGVIAFLVATGFYLMGTFPAGDGIYLRLCLTIAISVLILVIYGSLVGSMLPFLLRLCHVDPASASAPFVTTIVDVSSIIIYFTIALMLLKVFLL
ncbi:MAG: magnesium transporter [Bradymonadales bacterium]|nr:magnesium transporter [Bradymonadales bacterium]